MMRNNSLQYIHLKQMMTATEVNEDRRGFIFYLLAHLDCMCFSELCIILICKYILLRCILAPSEYKENIYSFHELAVKNKILTLTRIRPNLWKFPFSTLLEAREEIMETFGVLHGETRKHTNFKLQPQTDLRLQITYIFFDFWLYLAIFGRHLKLCKINLGILHQNLIA